MLLLASSTLWIGVQQLHLLLLEALVACLLLDQAMHMIYSHVAFHLLSLSTAWLLPLEALVASLLLAWSRWRLVTSSTDFHFFVFAYGYGLVASRDVKHGRW